MQTKPYNEHTVLYYSAIQIKTNTLYYVKLLLFTADYTTIFSSDTK